MPTLNFVKYHGLGNDFIIVDRLDGGVPLSPENARFLCDRHLGVGADGVLSLWTQTGVMARMEVQNADGSSTDMCGNGLRCVARYLYDAGRASPGSSDIDLAVGRNSYAVHRVASDRYRIAMGKPALTHPDLPGDLAQGGDGRPKGEVSLHAGDDVFVGTAIFIGNPHFVIFTDKDNLWWLAEHHGPLLAQHPAFANRANVTFARVLPDHIEAVVLERGVGITQACGSGACAVGLSAVRRGLATEGRATVVQLPGGSLAITVDGDENVSMEGEAMRVFAGEVALP